MYLLIINYKKLICNQNPKNKNNFVDFIDNIREHGSRTRFYRIDFLLPIFMIFLMNKIKN
jgi:hypothetical protein